MNYSKRRLLFTFAFLFALPTCFGQANAAQNTPAQQTDGTPVRLPVYDVASIKPSYSSGGGWGIDVNHNRYSATNVLLKTLLESAYGIKEDFISGVPGPLNSARFDIEAKIVDADSATMNKLSRQQYGAMLQRLLAERFQLKAHIETRILPVYELVLLKGPVKLKQSPAESGEDGGMTTHNRELTAHNLPMTALANEITRYAQRKVFDKTRLVGKYDFSLKWSADDGADGLPSLFTALEEQLGLKLQPAKGPVEVLVVDSAAMPSEN